jgi:uncharacterized membrane protein
MSDATRVNGIELDVDTLKQQLRQAEKSLKAEQGKRIALERTNAELKRDNERLQAGMAAVTEDAQATIQTAASQLCAVAGFSMFFFALGQYCRAQLVDAVNAAHVVHREATTIDGLAALITAGEALMRDNTPETRKTLTEVHQMYSPMIKYHRENSDQVRAAITLLALQVFRGRLDRVMDGLEAVIEASDDAEVVRNLVTRGIPAELDGKNIVIKVPA